MYFQDNKGFQRISTRKWRAIVSGERPQTVTGHWSCHQGASSSWQWLGLVWCCLPPLAIKDFRCVLCFVMNTGCTDVRSLTVVLTDVRVKKKHQFRARSKAYVRAPWYTENWKSSTEKNRIQTTEIHEDQIIGKAQEGLKKKLRRKTSRQLPSLAPHHLTTSDTRWGNGTRNEVVKVQELKVFSTKEIQK